MLELSHITSRGQDNITVFTFKKKQKVGQKDLNTLQCKKSDIGKPRVL